ncbi:MAG: 3',5'-cyclic-nucleotide phosphodiesterase [Pyrinomonadaceae bacterium]|nr:3',5'-cyclic-nucleotide phosphodiesterase [Pyrinomonadaceae bacterium]
MRVQMLPSTIEPDGRASLRQHLPTLVIDDRVAIDAGCLALSCSDEQRSDVRDIVLTHVHLDHIAGLPLFIDDLFATLDRPVRIHATREMIDILERDIFNWSIYPRFSELRNSNGPVIEYHEFSHGDTFDAGHLTVESIAVNHKVGASGYIVSNGTSSIAITGDTAETEAIWQRCNVAESLAAVFVECAFPDELSDLAAVSCHLTPRRLKTELEKLTDRTVPVYIINIKSMYRSQVVDQIAELGIDQVEILEVGRTYAF